MKSNWHYTRHECDITSVGTTNDIPGHWWANEDYADSVVAHVEVTPDMGEEDIKRAVLEAYNRQDGPWLLRAYSLDRVLGELQPFFTSQYGTKDEAHLASQWLFDNYRTEVKEVTIQFQERELPGGVG